jgi:glutamate formiminotransferase
VSLEEARALAGLVRGPGVRALGLRVGEQVQVSCNLFDVKRARPSLVYDLVAERLPRTGAIERAELVGLIPESLLRDEDPGRWAQLGLGEALTIESRLVAR